MSKASEFFEKVSHPTRVKIVRLLETSPLNFSQLKNKLGIESSGNLDHHLKKLEGAVCLDSDGLYKLTDEGKEALKAIKSIEHSFTIKETEPVPQSRQVFRAFLVFLGIFTLATTTAALMLISRSMTFPSIAGVIFGLIGAIIGTLGAAFGLGKAIMADSKSSRQMTYFPSHKDIWMMGDWIANFVFFGSYLTLLFSIVYVAISSSDFFIKSLWLATSSSVLSILFITSLMITQRILEKANQTIQRLESEG